MLNLGIYGRSCADGDLGFVGDYLHTNEYLAGRRLQVVLNRQRRRRQSPSRAGRGGLSRREWKLTRATETARSG
jgi:hypothetical protein